MSSFATKATTTTQQLAAEPTAKKKFGKNLNKLTKPPAPTSAAPKQGASSRNGLLLLSTKRGSSSTAATSTAGGGGILSSKSTQPSSKPLPTLGLQYESNTSTHDALLGAVVGASRAESQQQPDAWGVADKQQQKSSHEDAPSETIHSTQTPINAADAVDNTTVSLKGDTSPPSPPQQQHRLEHEEARQQVKGPSWDEYGGRNISPEKLSHAKLVESDDTGLYMSRRARERAESRRSEEEARMIEQKHRAKQKLRELEEKYGPVETTQQPRERTLFDPNLPSSIAVRNPDGQRNGYKTSKSNSGAYDDSRDLMANRQPIQLSSYDDRDRGTSAGPRMLYDPKSGSMVAVPSKEEANKGRGRKERNKKGRNARDKDSKAERASDAEGPKAGRKGKGRRDDNLTNGRKNGVSKSSCNQSDSKRGQNVFGNKRLPRTCGVLYTTDSKGHYVCADGAEGDLGYGAHSVPGGKARNAEAYEQYMEKKKQTRSEAKSPNKHNKASGTPPASNNENDITLQTGLNGLDSEIKLDWVKPNEKISLVTGNDDSPMLQATAKAWAPSQAALSAAAAAAAERKATLTSSPNQEDLDEEEDDDDVPLGLGFDPTLNMDSMMQSPSSAPKNLDEVDFASLSLEPALHSSGKKTHSIFAFESGATWGANDTVAHNDWGMPTSASNAFSGGEQSSSVVPASFLSIGATTTWGGVPGLSGSALGGSLNDHSGSAAAGD